jgi:hypothetical protein
LIAFAISSALHEEEVITLFYLEEPIGSWLSEWVLDPIHSFTLLFSGLFNQGFWTILL